MKFKIDENLPVEVADLLRRSGHDATTVLEEEIGGSPDVEIVSICRQQGRALITLDTDFANIRAYPPNQYHGLVVLRVRRQSKTTVIEAL